MIGNQTAVRFDQDPGLGVEAAWWAPTRATRYGAVALQGAEPCGRVLVAGGLGCLHATALDRGWRYRCDLERLQQLGEGQRAELCGCQAGDWDQNCCVSLGRCFFFKSTKNIRINENKETPVWWFLEMGDPQSSPWLFQILNTSWSSMTTG